MPDFYSSLEFLFIKAASVWSETKSSNHTVVSNHAADYGAVLLAYQFQVEKSFSYHLENLKK